MNISKININYLSKINNAQKHIQKTHFTSVYDTFESTKTSKQENFTEAKEELNLTYETVRRGQKYRQERESAITRDANAILESAKKAIKESQKEGGNLVCAQQDSDKDNAIELTKINTQGRTLSVVQKDGKIVEIRLTTPETGKTDLYCFNSDEENSLKSYIQGIEQISDSEKTAEAEYDFEDNAITSLKLNTIHTVAENNTCTVFAQEIFGFKYGTISDYKSQARITNSPEGKSVQAKKYIQIDIRKDKITINKNYSSDKNYAFSDKQFTYHMGQPVECKENTKETL